MAEFLEAACLSSLAGVRHGFFTRRGGVSEGIYASLNAGLGSSDPRPHVLENRARVAAALGASRPAVITVHQVHSAEAIFVDRPFAEGQLPRGDAIVTRTPGLAIAALAADCAPVLFADVEAGLVGAAHAGWRGAFTGIVEATLAAMEREGADRSRIVAAVGPCINAPAYEVGPEFEARFLDADPANARFFEQAPTGRPHFDLPGYVHSRLLASGVACAERLTPCTYENESDFFSFRRSTHRSEPDYGRHISAIVLAQR
jgi:YfiH family protein